MALLATVLPDRTFDALIRRMASGDQRG
jgi:hypothetical protein